MLVVFSDAPRRPVRERARELNVGIRVGELVRDRLIDADGLAELLAGRRVLDAELEHALRDPDGFARRRGTGARQVSHAGERRSVTALEPAERAARVDRRLLDALRGIRGA